MKRRKSTAAHLFTTLAHADSSHGDSEEVNLAPLQIIRTETALSRLPVHNLAKTGEIKIVIKRMGKGGKNDLYWEVHYSAGQPRQLAYRVDSIVMNRRIDEAGQETPKRLRLGSLTEICEELGITASGKTREAIKQALIQ